MTETKDTDQTIPCTGPARTGGLKRDVYGQDGTLNIQQAILVCKNCDARSNIVIEEPEPRCPSCDPAVGAYDYTVVAVRESGDIVCTRIRHAALRWDTLHKEVTQGPSRKPRKPGLLNRLLAWLNGGAQ